MALLRISSLKKTPRTNPTLRRARFRQDFPYILMALPAIVLFAVFVIYPLLGGFYYSLTNWNGIDNHLKFVGLANYFTLFNDRYVLQPIANSFKYAFVVTIFQNIVSLLLAIALDQQLKSKNLLRAFIFIPALLSPLIVGYIWGFIFMQPLAALGKMLNWGFLANNALGNASTSLEAAMFVTIWRMAGWTMVVYIAGLQAIPQSLYEAAAVDGSGEWHKFRHITFPLIAPAFTVNMVITLERAFKEFDLLFSLTGGGPGHASEVIALTIYQESFANFRAGYGTAIGVILFIILVVLTMIQLKFLRKREEDVTF
jgi:raffinose/stachyose/melibiose transport system permease protein